MPVQIPDPRFETPELFEPNKKPVGNVVLKPTRGLKAVTGLYGGVIKNMPTFQTGSGVVGTAATITPPTITGNDGGGSYVNIPEFNINSDSVTVFAVFEKSGVTEPWSAPISYYQNTDLSRRFEISLNGTSSNLYFQSSSGAWSRAWSITPANDTKISCVMTRDAAETIRVYYLDKDGYQYDEVDDSASNAVNAVVRRAFIQASALNSTTRAWRGKLYSGGIFNRAISDSEAKSLLYNQYQILIPA